MPRSRQPRSSASRASGSPTGSARARTGGGRGAVSPPPPSLRVRGRREAALAELIDFGLGDISERTGRGGDRPNEHGVIAPVRTYESPIDRRLEAAGFNTVSMV